ncbi:NACHT, LRR and PYD domains-containing protein 3 [Electrophorus electricus]|uniref:Si:ch73-233m11.2 n=1 Tax=Electrophorus electricus TaxID=8005 RepID=A0A4W4GLB4_ELEEL|nr:NACHT, LRR and PYD domains-containing protein 3 [Electrophorus electricus]
MSARMDTQCSTEFLREVQKLHKEKLRNDVLNSVQRSSLLGGQSAKEVILGNRYTALSASLSEEASLVEDGTWEALEVLLTEAFAAGHESLRVMLCGGAGMGKTIAVEKLIWDWAAGSCLQHYTLLLRVCVQALCMPGDSLQGVLLSTHAHLSAEALTLALQTPHKLLLVLDELDGFLLDPPPSDVLVCDLQQPAGGAVLLHSLLQGSLLPGASLLLTSREPVILETVQNIYILGFSHAQRRAYFRGFLEVGVEEVLDRCERAVGVAELWACPAFCWTLCQQAQQECVPDTLSELLCMVTHTLLQEHGVDMQTARELLAGLGKLANHCTHLDLLCCTRSDLITCGLEPFLTSPILFAFLHMVGCDVTSPDGTFSFLSPVLREFLQAVSFYVSQSEYDGGGILEEYQDLCLVFLAGLSDPVQRKLLETSAGPLGSDRLSEFHRWLMGLAAQVLPGYGKREHWRVLRLLHHAHSPALIRESVASSTWRAISYSGLQGPDCAALAFVVSCLGEMEHLNLYMSALTEEQAQKITPAVQLAKSISLSQSRVSVGVITQFGRAMSEGHVNQLDLSYCTLGDEGAQSLCTSLQLSRLHTLTLRSCALTPVCSEALSKLLCGSKLRELDLGGNELQDQGVSRLLSALGPSVCALQELRLDRCALSGACVAPLSSAMCAALSVLRMLDLSWNSLAGDSLELLSQTLQSGCCCLTTLRLFDCELTDSCCSSLAAALQSEKCCLVELDLSVNELHQSGAILICDALKAPSCSLEKLCMVRCELSDEVFSALGSVLGSGVSRLKHLAIGLNPAASAGVKHIWKALKHTHCRLQHLDLEMMELTDTCVDELCEAITANNSLTTLILKNNSLTDASVPRMIKLIQDHPIMNELNLQYNDFCEDVFDLMERFPAIKY